MKSYLPKLLWVEESFRCFIFFVAWAGSAEATTVYQPDLSTAFTNPERGYRFNIELINDPSVNAYSTDVLAPFADESLQAYQWVPQVYPGITVLRSYLHLDLWQDGTPLPQEFLTNLASGLAAVRAAGLKIILRPCYTWATVNTTPVTESTILGHIAQIYPIIAANSDVVMSLQTGWLGEYGEWHDSNVDYTDVTSRSDADVNYTIVKAILDATPATLPLEIRYPIYLREILNLPVPSGSSALTQTDRDRLGYHCDGFLWDYFDGSDYNPPWGLANGISWTGFFTASQYRRWIMDRRTSIGGNVSIDGEPINFSASLRTQQYMNDPAGLNAQYYMSSLHWTAYESIDASGELAIWQAAQLAASGNDPAETLYVRQQRKMGYRLRLISANYSKSAASGGTYPISVSLNNDGYAGPIKVRPIYLVFDSGVNRYNVAIPNTDVRTWVSGPVGLSQNVSLPSMQPGTYKLALWLPDAAANLQSNPAYSIRLANLGTWDSTNGYNVLDPSIAVGPSQTAAGSSSPLVYASPCTFSTSAGNAGAARNTGQFCNPSAIALDGDGNLYIADTGNDTIRMVSPTGVVSTIAGQVGVAGSSDGQGSAALFNEPSGIAVGTDGTIYVADSNNDTVREITPGGMVTTLAGTAGQIGSSDGVGAAAQFQYPAGMAVDANGNVFVADEGNQTVRKITAGGVVSTIAGVVGSESNSSPHFANGSGTKAIFYQPMGVAVDGAGNLYVADAGNNEIREISPTGLVSSLAGYFVPNAYSAAYLATGADGAGSSASFFLPSSVSVDSAGNLYVADTYEDTIRKISPSGIVSTLAGAAMQVGDADGPGGSARFSQPSGTAVDASGDVYVADAGNNTVRKITPAGVVSTLAGTAGYAGSTDGLGGGSQFVGPNAVALDSAGNAYVADLADDTIRMVSPSGVVTTLAGSSGIMGGADGTGTEAQFFNPAGVALDGSGNIYVADTGNDTLRKVTAAGVVTTWVGTVGQAGSSDGAGGSAGFDQPSGLAVDGGDDVYVADSANDTLRKITPAGVVTTLAGSAGQAGGSDGTGSGARFNRPSGLAIDGGGNLYVADTGNDIIRKVTPTGVVTTLAGAAGQTGSADGAGILARFDQPSGLAMDAGGNLYVADAGNGTIRMISPAGTVTTLAGAPGQMGDVDGNGASVRFFYPTGIAVGRNGQWVVADSGNNTLRLGLLLGAGGGGPSFASQPVSQSIESGGIVVFNAATSGSAATTYQWQLDGVDIPGATGPTLLITGATSSNAGTYTCVAIDSGGAVISSAANLAVTAASSPGRLTNLSVNTSVASSGVSVGFVVGGSGTNGSETLLIRASGPALAAFGIANFLPDPTLTIVDQASGATVAQNAGWGTPAGNATAVEAAITALDAFAWTNTSSLDSGLVTSLAANGSGYSVDVVGKSGDSGTTIAEVWDNTADYTLTTPRLVNLSCRQLVLANGTLTAGFIVGGTTSETVLIRAMGPTLATFGLSPVMPDPQLQVFPLGGGTPIAANAGWGGNPAIVRANSLAFAFVPASSSSLDSEIVVTLPPGAYTAQATSASGAAGLVQVEVYEVP